MAQLEITTTMVPVADHQQFESAITDKTKLVWIEPFGNPLLFSCRLASTVNYLSAEECDHCVRQHASFTGAMSSAGTGC